MPLDREALAQLSSTVTDAFPKVYHLADKSYKELARALAWQPQGCAGLLTAHKDGNLLLSKGCGKLSGEELRREQMRAENAAVAIAAGDAYGEPDLAAVPVSQHEVVFVLTGLPHIMGYALLAYLLKRSRIIDPLAQEVMNDPNRSAALESMLRGANMDTVGYAMLTRDVMNVS